MYLESNARSCASLAAEIGSAGASIGFKPSSFPGIIALVWFDGLVTPGLTSGVAGSAGLGGTVPDAGAGVETTGGVVTDAEAAGAGCGSTCGAGAAAGAALVSDAVGVAAGWVPVDAGGAGVGVTVLVAGAAPGSGDVAVVAVFVSAGAGWFECESDSPAALAAAGAGVSFARAGMKLARKTIAQTVGSSLKICMMFFYAKFPPDATAFPVVENNFCHAPGMG